MQKKRGITIVCVVDRHFKREIAAFDIQTKRCDVYGQGDGFTDRAMLMYDGLHYDALAVSGMCVCLYVCKHDVQ